MTLSVGKSWSPFLLHTQRNFDWDQIKQMKYLFAIDV